HGSARGPGDPRCGPLRIRHAPRRAALGERPRKEQTIRGREISITAVLAVVLIAAAVLAWPSPSQARDRLLRLRAEARRDPAGNGADHANENQPQGSRSARVWWQAAACGAAGAVGVGGMLGLVVGAAVAAAGVALARRREPVEALRRRERLIADLPFAAEMLAACLRAGQPTRAAVEAVAEAMGGPLGETLAAVGRRLMLGAD